MSIRYKLLFFFLVQHFLFLFAALLLSEFIIRPHNLEIEQRNSNEKISQIKNVFSNELKHLHLLTVDWAVWEESYTFMDDRNERFLLNNLPSNILETASLSRIEFFDRTGRSISKMNSKALNISSLLDKKGFLKKEYAQWKTTQEVKGKYGVIKLEDKISLVSFYPILAGNRVGENRGTLMMVRVIDKKMIENINKSTNAKINLLELKDNALNNMFNDQEVVSEVINPQTLKVNSYLLGADNKVSVILQILIQREYVKESEKLIFFLFVFAGILGFISFIISFFLLRREVVNPLNALGKHIENIRKNESFVTSGLASREDEIGLLAKEFNTLITKIDKTNQTLAKVARIDALTNLANRLDLEERFENERKQSCRENQDMSILMLDIDFFKKYNDTYGHVKGDIVLAWIAQAIKESGLRPRDYVARYGGEEFIVILPKTHVSGSVIVAQRILENVRNLEIEHISTGLNEKIVTVSIGCTTLVAQKDESQEFIINLADEALYTAKENGRNQFFVYQRNNA